ncbi:MULTISPECIES: metal-dependent hydrolase [Halolamina]|uniref:LexA-binding, inner membrane-associated putative hydrolase n=1 Tax=Halolamina pelagica TaxID=699431 RepID=A0A1I5QNP3_9EURY|nr:MULTISPECIES: metal-dependent hydrolase [Halolamina]NHX35471.1 metal-dependent hydrolase [Halolamina sp. R1-12]SFP47863.1 LexA-binding, inner membrane-associated putative hydrolase [Halolamina pelagica]
MPSTLVHVAVGGLVGAALLGDRFTPRAIAVVLVAAAVPDLDSFLAPVVAGAHRSALHTLLLPALVGLLVYVDARVLDRSRLGERWGPDAPYVAGVAVAALLAGGILPDLVTNGVNAFWPLHDQFYTVDGELKLSTTEGLVQTFVDLSPEETSGPSTTDNTRYSTGADPTPWKDRDGPVERVFPVVTAGWQLMLVGLSAATVSVRSWQTRGR